MLRKIGFVAFGIFVAISAAYVAGRIIVEIGLGYDWAALIFAVVFAAAVLLIDRPHVGER
jgi:hypothetical protein